MAKKLAGIIAPITTPFVNEDVSLEHLKSNMRKYRDTGLAGFFAIGSRWKWRRKNEAGGGLKV